MKIKLQNIDNSDNDIDTLDNENVETNYVKKKCNKWFQENKIRWKWGSNDYWR